MVLPFVMSWLLQGSMPGSIKKECSAFYSLTKPITKNVLTCFFLIIINHLKYTKISRLSLNDF